MNKNTTTTPKPRRIRRPRKPRIDHHRLVMNHLVDRINAINEWRNEAIKSAINPRHRNATDARAFELRDAAERAAAVAIHHP